MRCITAPDSTYESTRLERSLFLAGGITGCPDWQQEMIRLLQDHDRLALLNPRRADFPMGDPNAALAQITWEFNHLRLADAILFWFPEETLCPIVLYELGTWTGMLPRKPLFIGAHPGYKRRADVRIQSHLARPGLAMVDSLDALAEAVRQWLRSEELVKRLRRPAWSWE